MDKLKQTNKQKGQLLIEAMIAVSMMMVGMLGVFGVLSQSLGLNRVAADQYAAVNLASEGIEIVKNLLDSDYLNTQPFGSSIAIDSRCAIDYETIPLWSAGGSDTWDCSGAADDKTLYFEDGIYSYDSGGEPTNFVRYVDIEWNNPVMRVRSTVEWRGRGGIDFDVVLEDEFWNWR